MSRIADNGERWSVICADYRKDGFCSEAEAERWRERVEAAGNCRLEHEVITR